MRFSSPSFLVLLLTVAWFWKTGRPFGTRALRRAGVAALLVLAIAGLEIRGGSSPLSVMFVVDRSASMDRRGAESLPALLASHAAGMRPGDTAGVVVFGADAAIERLPAADLDVAQVTSAVDSTSTNVAGALRLARSAFPDGSAPRMVLVSDGDETAGNALDEGARLAGDGVPVDVVIPRESASRSRPPVVARLSAPDEVRVGEPFTLTAAVTGSPGERADIVLTDQTGNSQTRSITLPPDGTAAVSFSASPDRPGVYTYRASSAQPADDFDTGQDEAGAIVVASGQPAVLYAGERVNVLQQLLAGRAFIIHRTSPQSLPRTPAALSAYDAVVLDDVAVDGLGDARGAAIKGYVEELGGGLLVLGSPRSLHAGLSPDNPVQQILPIDLRPRSGRRAPGMALVVVFDKSGSMDDPVGGVPKIELARQAIGRVLESIAGADALGVIAFDAQPVAVAPLGTGYSAADISSRLRRIQPGGATALAPALHLAADWLDAAADATRRHVLLVSDGRAPAADAARARDAVRRSGFEVTTVALGGDTDRALLTTLAESTGGRAYFPEDVRELPSILAREAARVSGGGTVEEPFRLRTSSHVLTSGLDPSQMPQLGGYVAGAARPSASVALRSHLDDPILATRQAGLGKVAVYTADFHSPWSNGLRTWSGTAPLVAQTLRWLGRTASSRALYTRFEERDGGTRVVVQPLNPDGTARVSLDCRASVRPPSGETFEIALRERAPGRCEADVPMRTAGAYVFSIRAEARDRTFSASAVRGTYWTAAREKTHTGVNRAMLTTLAGTTGGRVLTGTTSAFDAPRPPAYIDARPWLATAALILFLIDTLGTGAVAAIRARTRRRDTQLFEEAA